MSLIIPTIVLVLYFRYSRKVEPRILDLEQRANHCFMIKAKLTNTGRRIAKNCSVHVYIENNKVPELGYILIERPFGKISEEWSAPTSFDIYPYTPIIVRENIDIKYEGKEVELILLHNGKKIPW